MLRLIDARLLLLSAGRLRSRSFKSEHGRGDEKANAADPPAHRD